MRVVLIVLFWMPLWILAQNGTISGRVKSRENQPVSEVQIQFSGQNKTLLSDSLGYWSVSLPAGNYTLTLSKDGYLSQQQTINLGRGQQLYIPLVLAEKSIQLQTTEIRDIKKATDFSNRPFEQLFPISPKEINRIPTPKSDIESRLGTLPGVVINNEFSSQYRVRGGNFDENLVYVNGVEIYRPFLVRAGQMEGLGFTNANLVSEVNFSSGGFQAKYGDKLSSVLDVTYNTPEKFRGTAEIGLITTNIHAEGISKNRRDSTEAGRFTWLVGGRRFDLSNLLAKQDNRGEYRPSFYDIQTVFTWKPYTRPKASREKIDQQGKPYLVEYPEDRWKITLIATGAYNRYLFLPQSRVSTFGSIQAVLRLFVASGGREEMGYLTTTNAFIAEHTPSYRFKSRYIVTAFRTIESELYDVENAYRLSDVNTNTASEEFNEAVFDRAVGGYFNHGRNYLVADVVSAEQQGTWLMDRRFRHTLHFGLRGQYQRIDDQLDEYRGADSAGYFRITERLKSRAQFDSRRTLAYVQHTWKAGKNHVLVTGARLNYWDLNEQLLFSPRVQYVFTPLIKDSLRPLQFRLAAGVYQQPPFYRELRGFDGSVNTQLKAQRSFHFIGGGDYQFYSWGRPFKLFVEGYYKKMENVIPYEIDNVRIRYYANNQATAYAYGLDSRINGEFIKGVDSWFSLGLLNTREDLTFDNRGYYPRPSAQWMTLSLYFQDEMPHNPTFKAHVNAVYGSGLPFGPPGNVNQRNVFNAPAYRRFDIGFSKMLSFRSEEERQKKLSAESVWISLEVYNILATNNVVSYLWIKDIYNTQFAVPNYLSRRMLNIRAIVRF